MHDASAGVYLSPSPEHTANRMVDRLPLLFFGGGFRCRKECEIGAAVSVYLRPSPRFGAHETWRIWTSVQRKFFPLGSRLPLSSLFTFAEIAMKRESEVCVWDEYF